MAVKPIKRGKALLPLSREHHFDLLLAWKIRQGLKNNVSPDRIAAYIDYLDKNLMDSHFRDEEVYLFDALPADDEPCNRARKEHHEIRTLVSEICEKKNQDPAIFNELADKVEAHVRFEERELFPYLEEKLSPERLQEIEAVMDENHDHFQEVWDDSFWVRK